MPGIETNALTRPIDLVANTGPKALTYMGLCDLAEVTVDSLGNHMQGRYDLEHSRRAALGAYVVTFTKFDYAQRYIAPSSSSSRNVRKYAPRHQEEVFPAIGATLGWAAIHGPLEPVLGQTSSANNNSRGPLNSIIILQNILAGVSILNIEGHRYSQTSHNSRLDSLVEGGIILPEEDASRFTIGDPSYRGKRIPFEQLKPITRHIYTTLQVAKESEPGREWSIDEVLSLAISLLPEAQRADGTIRAALKSSIYDAVSAGSRKDFGQAVHKVTPERGLYRIAEQYAPAVADLVERASKLSAGDKDFVRDAAAAAHELYRDIPTGIRLMQQASGGSS